ncbi:MAG: hypothetical protein IJX20_04020 [Alphaproteobacteria bacterium]|nr:hypothetical protein [Alphaproteobacteria bacterium]
MQKYMDINGDSGVYGYEIGTDYIKVQFKDGSIYTYTYLSAGRDKVETMKILAKSGNGLNSFINRYARKLYA